MIGVVGGAVPVPEEEAVLWSSDYLVVVERYEKWSVCEHYLSIGQGEVFKINDLPSPQSYSPFTGLHAVCYALNHPRMNPGTPVYCAYMDLYAVALGTTEDYVHHRAHDRARHALMFKELKRVHGDRLIFPERLSSAIEELSKLPPSPVRVRTKRRSG